MNNNYFGGIPNPNMYNEQMLKVLSLTHITNTTLIML